MTAVDASSQHITVYRWLRIAAKTIREALINVPTNHADRCVGIAGYMIFALLA